MTSDWFMSGAMIIFMLMILYLLLKERKHKSLMAFARNQLLIYSFDKDTLKEFGDTLTKLSIEQRLSLLYSLFGKGRPIKTYMRVYDSGVVIDGIFADETLDKKEEKQKRESYIN